MVDALDALVTSIHALSTDTTSNWTALLQQLRQQENNLPRAGPPLRGALDALDPARHTLGYIFLLDALPHNADASEAFIAVASRALLAADAAQVKLAPDKFASVCRRLRDACVSPRSPCRGLAPLAAAVQAVAPTEQHLTPQHVDLLQLSLLAHNYTAAMPLLEHDVFDIAPQQTAVTAKDFALYCLYAGMLLCALKRYARAAELFMQALITPAHMLNAIQLACYKKLILVSLLTEGSVPALPKYASSAVSRHVRSGAVAYHDLEKAFTSREAGVLAACMASHEAAFRADGNWGLCMHVAAALPGRAVERLTSTYMTLSLADLAVSAGLAGGAREAEALVLRCVGEGRVFARIDARSGMVAFKQESGQFCTRSVAVRIGAQLDAIMALAQRVRMLDERLQTDTAFLSKSLQLDRLPSDGGPRQATQPGSQGAGGLGGMEEPSMDIAAPGQVDRDVDAIMAMMDV